MEVKINREIRDYTESVFFGMSLRQCVFAAAACVAAVALYFALDPYLGLEELSWVCILGAAPFAAIGFIRWHSMTAEQFIITWIKSEVLTSKRLISRPENLYFDAIKHAKKRRVPTSKPTTWAATITTHLKAAQTNISMLSPKRLTSRLKTLYANALMHLLEHANGKRDAHDKNSH